MLSERAASESIKVFYSYVEDVRTFVEQFSGHFIDNKGVMRKFDWLIDPVPAGAELHAQLVEKINEADVFIAFVDKRYPDKIGAEELKLALEARSNSNSRPLLIPIILGIDALNWWTKIKDNVRAPVSLSNIVYQKFYYSGTNRWRSVTSDEEQDIHDLRDWVLQYSWGQQTDPSGPPQTTAPLITVPRIATPPISPPQTSRTAQPDVAGDEGGVRRRVAVALQALDSLEAHMTTLREFFSNIDDLLRRDLESTKPAPSMGRREQIQAELDGEGVPSALSRAIVALIDRRDKAAEISNRESRNLELLKIADELNALIKRERQPKRFIAPGSNQKGASAFYYIARMEEALMRMQTEKPEALAAAIRIYTDLETSYPDKPTIPYRLGWAFYREQNYDEAVLQYSKARYLIKEALAPHPAERTGVMEGHELTQMRQRLPRYIGLIYWKMSDENDRHHEIEKQLDNLMTAYNVATEGLGVSEDTDLYYHNDLLYYGVRYLEVFEKNRDNLTNIREPEITKDMMSKHLGYLESKIELETHNSPEELDSLCYAYDFLQRGDEAVRAAKRLQYLLFDAPNHPTALDPLQTSAAARVARVIARYRA